MLALQRCVFFNIFFNKYTSKQQNNVVHSEIKYTYTFNKVMFSRKTHKLKINCYNNKQKSTYKVIQDEYRTYHVLFNVLLG